MTHISRFTLAAAGLAASALVLALVERPEIYNVSLAGATGKIEFDAKGAASVPFKN